MAHIYQITTLLREVVKRNTHPDLRAYFMDPYARQAIAGYRRAYGIGDCLVRLTDPQLDIGQFPNVPFHYSYDQKEPMTHVYGLRGKPDPKMVFERVGLIEADQYFNAVLNDVVGPGTCGVLLNPKRIVDWMEETTNGNMENFKANVHVFNGIGIWRGMPMFPADVIIRPDGVPVALIKRPGGVYDQAFIDDRSSFVETNRLKANHTYVVQGVSVQDGVTTVRVLREFRRGIRIALQYYRDGLFMPGDPEYSVFVEPDNNIKERDILDIPFIEGQRTEEMTRTPMLHFDADTLHRALKPMTMLPVAEMRFRNSFTGIYITTISKDDELRIEAIVGPTSPYKRGKVYTY